ncbi:MULTISPECIES: O-antigen ligase family protein [Actinoplanes]|uniref:O-antigen ligase family protein n=1 Tax=Actinoplanes TaxID=1865 RepID=UPI00069834A2|nr:MULTISPECIES: O-antigen ligase family protein [Actinoplanes]GLY05274.1 O-antigen polymerase [Actinoplanes sp. NBRC 101535]
MSLSLHPADLDPTLVADRTYATRRRFTRIDAAGLLSILIVLLMLIPARLILPALSDVGRPAVLLGLGLWCWWVLVRFSPRLMVGGPQPLRWAVLIYMVALLISYAAGYWRGLSAMEANGADRAILAALAFTGVILTGADGIPNWARLRGVLKTLVWCAGIVGFLGLVQFAFFFDFTQYIVVPGLSSNGVEPGFEWRGGAIRVASTMTHYIEFSTVMAMTLPFAIHFARFAPTRLGRQVFMLVALVVAAAIPATVSRTGFVAVGLAVLVMIPVWGWRMRYNMAVVGVGLLAGLLVMKPTLANTLIGLFAGAGEDTSITARTKRYEMVGYYFTQRPWWGRGTGTWISPQYQFLDNQWLAQALSTGVVGVAALAGLHLTAIGLAAVSMRRAITPADRDLCAALIATQVIALVVAAFFDSLSFSTYAMVLALMIGLTGAVWRMTHPARIVRTTVSRRSA